MREGGIFQETSFTKPSRHSSKSISAYNQFHQTLQINMWFVGSGRDEDVGDFNKIIFNMWFAGSGREGGRRFQGPENQ